MVNILKRKIVDAKKIYYQNKKCFPYINSLNDLVRLGRKKSLRSSQARSFENTFLSFPPTYVVITMENKRIPASGQKRRQHSSNSRLQLVNSSSKLKSKTYLVRSLCKKVFYCSASRLLGTRFVITWMKMANAFGSKLLPLLIGERLLRRDAITRSFARPE